MCARAGTSSPPHYSRPLPLLLRCALPNPPDTMGHVRRFMREGHKILQLNVFMRVQDPKFCTSTSPLPFSSASQTLLLQNLAESLGLCFALTQVHMDGSTPAKMCGKFCTLNVCVCAQERLHLHTPAAAHCPSRVTQGSMHSAAGVWLCLSSLPHVVRIGTLAAWPSLSAQHALVSSTHGHTMATGEREQEGGGGWERRQVDWHG